MPTKQPQLYDQCVVQPRANHANEPGTVQVRNGRGRPATKWHTSLRFCTAAL